MSDQEKANFRAMGDAMLETLRAWHEERMRPGANGIEVNHTTGEVKITEDGIVITKHVKPGLEFNCECDRAKWEYMRQCQKQGR